MKTVTAAIIIHKGKVLITRRKLNDKYLPGKWEFPGGKVEQGETPEDCLVREIKEELDLNIKITQFFGESIYEYPFFIIRLLAFLAQPVSGKIKLNDHAEARWVEIKDLNFYDFAPADLPFVEKLLKLTT
ncbi:8-oxo-dGTP diphosphatase MutT [Carboxydothermus ferrireducens]|uniref:8-oxo-dGTP diphosphatase n=1 Tax=Carboxydothermus ferrireducens DSM 11255 TaxID=1119529 RepID=A0ABX2RDY7_9THEO|nr:8-oxo-dGTP diphosphatase MutT [Carboxydothermus ferrireducens]NYE58107.1 8-oxo-dGTP diphosphatase [Carboxydothermus ferrireducens DSM 11255]